MVLGNDAWILKVEPRALGGEIHAAAGVTCPAVKALVPEVVGIGVRSVLNSVVALSIEPILALEELREAASHFIRVENVSCHVKWHKTLKELLLILQLTKRAYNGIVMFCFVI